MQRMRVVEDMVFSPGDVFRLVGLALLLNDPMLKSLPQPHTVVACTWGRMLPLTVAHRQLATPALITFRYEKLRRIRYARSPNRYSAADWCSLLNFVKDAAQATCARKSFCSAENLALAKQIRYQAYPARKKVRG